jgi:hypothetical protein
VNGCGPRQRLHLTLPPREPATLSPVAMAPWLARLGTSTNSYPVDMPTGLMILSKLKEGGVDVDWMAALKLALKMWAWAPDTIGQLDVWPLSSHSMLHFDSDTNIRNDGDADQPVSSLSASPPAKRPYSRSIGSFSGIIHGALTESGDDEAVVGMLDEDGRLQRSHRAGVLSQNLPLAPVQEAPSVASPSPTRLKRADMSAITVLAAAHLSSFKSDNVRICHHINILRIARQQLLRDSDGQRPVEHGELLPLNGLTAKLRLLACPTPLRVLLVGSGASSMRLTRESAPSRGVSFSQSKLGTDGLSVPLLHGYDSSVAQAGGCQEATVDAISRRLAYSDIMCETSLVSTMDTLLLATEDLAHCMAFGLRINISFEERGVQSCAWDARMNRAINSALSTISAAAIRSGLGAVILDVRNISRESHAQWAHTLVEKLLALMLERLVAAAQVAAVAVLVAGSDFDNKFDDDAGFVPVLKPSTLTNVKACAMQILTRHLRVFSAPYIAFVRPETIPETQEHFHGQSQVPTAFISSFLHPTAHEDDVGASAHGVDERSWRNFVNIIAEQSIDRRTITHPLHLITALPGPKQYLPFSQAELNRNHGLSSLHRRPFIRVATAAWPELMECVGVPIALYGKGIDPARVLAVRDVLLRCHVPFMSILLD